MNGFRSYLKRGSSLRGRASFFLAESGNALLYVLLAISLLGALTYAYVQDSHDNYASQSSVQIAESLLSQINMIKAAIVQCTLEYPGGGLALDATGSANYPNSPYPLKPSSAYNLTAPGGCTTTSNATGCITDTAITPGDSDDDVRNLACIGAPAGGAYMFQGASSQGRFLPPPTSGFGEWTYGNDGTGVYIQITSGGDAAGMAALNRLLTQFSTGQASLTGTTFKAWIIQG